MCIRDRPEAIKHLLWAPNELGLGRAYVAGQLDLEGDIYDLLQLKSEAPELVRCPKQVLDRLGRSHHDRGRARADAAPVPEADGDGHLGAEQAAHDRLEE